MKFGGLCVCVCVSDIDQQEKRLEEEEAEAQLNMELTEEVAHAKMARNLRNKIHGNCIDK
ncbi:hypothetical protein RchiOBHm_Chr5g0003161 [Rosa chinensis]|uniref:Uncharacterized protein n=1 Tax=Rosa chinensis TaxID=74649 RepID=A0A2P6Q2M8_ROSCH|nr:hypothetical protein RchiOBHm_Chr5g0003161 [Rosa chinensis]